MPLHLGKTAEVPEAQSSCSFLSSPHESRPSDDGTVANNGTTAHHNCWVLGSLFLSAAPSYLQFQPPTATTKSGVYLAAQAAAVEQVATAWSTQTPPFPPPTTPASYPYVQSFHISTTALVNLMVADPEAEA